MRYNALATALTVLIVLCATACSTSRKAIAEHSSEFRATESRNAEARDSVVVEVHDTLTITKTIIIRENETGDTVFRSEVTDREHLTTRERAKATEVKVIERIDTVYIQKDSVSVEDKKIGLSASADGGSKRSGLSELFLCHDSGKPKRAWSLRSLLHRFKNLSRKSCKRLWSR